MTVDGSGADPSVSVVITNYRLANDTITAVEGVRALEYPQDRVEIVVVDNASGDGSADKIRRHASGARVVVTDTNYGRAGGNNVGAQHANGHYLAFLNPNARPEPNWLRAAVDELVGDLTLGSVASKVTDWDGRRIDQAEGAATFDGHAAPGRRGQDDIAQLDESGDVLFASATAMVVARTLFEEVGGFDQRYFMYGEDLDLGWRLWLLGYRVRYVPASSVRHRQHGVIHQVGVWHRDYLEERNALLTAYKNYDDINVSKALAAATMLTVRRGMERGEEPRGTYDLANGPSSGLDLDTTASHRALASMHAIDDALSMLPEFDATRRDVQATRLRSDAELTRLFRMPFAPVLDSLGTVTAVEATRRAFGLDEVFGERRRVAVISGDVFGSRMAGPAIRAFEMARALSTEHEVRLVSLVGADLQSNTFTIETANDEDDVRQIESWCDVIIFQGFLIALYPFLNASSKVIVVDLYDPFHLEQLENQKYRPIQEANHVIHENVKVLNEQIRRGDFFLCASEKQRDFWLGQFSALDRINPRVYREDESLRSLLAVVPFGVGDRPPARTVPALRGVIEGVGHDDKVILWGGGIYNWFDPATLIRAIDLLRERVPEVRLVFMGTRHPNPEVPEMRATTEAYELAAQLGLRDKHVFFNEGWVPYKERQNFLLDADIGVSTHLNHVETAFSFRTRILDYFWAGLPVVSTEGDALAEVIEHRGVGRIVPPGDVEALEEALFELLTNEELRAECSRRSTEVGREYRWANSLAPLLSFCRRARRAPDRLPWAPPPPEALGVTAPSEGSLPNFLATVRRDLATAKRMQRDGGMAPVLAHAGQKLRATLGRARP